MIAHCGLDCSVCPAYVATQANDHAAKEQLLARWRVDFNSPEMPMEAVTCDGCTSAGRHGGYCGSCPIRACALERNLATCAHCAEYGCGKMAFIASASAQAKSTLEAIRQSL